MGMTNTFKDIMTGIKTAMPTIKKGLQAGCAVFGALAAALEVISPD